MQVMMAMMCLHVLLVVGVVVGGALVALADVVATYVALAATIALAIATNFSFCCCCCILLLMMLLLVMLVMMLLLLLLLFLLFFVVVADDVVADAIAVAFTALFVADDICCLCFCC
jgi:hypothetical protein